MSGSRLFGHVKPFQRFPDVPLDSAHKLYGTVSILEMNVSMAKKGWANRKQLTVRAQRTWGRGAFLKAGEATFGSEK